MNLQEDYLHEPHVPEEISGQEKAELSELEERIAKIRDEQDCDDGCMFVSPTSADISAHQAATAIALVLDPRIEDTPEEFSENFGKRLHEVMWDVANHLWRNEPCGEYLECAVEEAEGKGHRSCDCPRMDEETKGRIRSPFEGYAFGKDYEDDGKEG